MFLSDLFSWKQLPAGAGDRAKTESRKLLVEEEVAESADNYGFNTRSDRVNN